MNQKELETIKTSIDNETKRIAEVEDKIKRLETSYEMMCKENRQKENDMVQKIMEMNKSVMSGQKYIERQKEMLEKGEAELNIQEN